MYLCEKCHYVVIALRPNLVCCFSSTILTKESLKMNSEEVEELEIGSGTKAIPLSLDKSSNVETFEEGTLTT
jgi:hypothetical protein